MCVCNLIYLFFRSYPTCGTLMTCVLARGRFASELNLLYPYSSEPIDVKKTHLLGSLPAEALTAMLQDEVRPNTPEPATPCRSRGSSAK